MVLLMSCENKKSTTYNSVVVLTIKGYQPYKDTINIIHEDNLYLNSDGVLYRGMYPIATNVVRYSILSSQKLK